MLFYYTNMASKRERLLKNSKFSKEKDYHNLNLNDVLCPICRSIFIEPVSLPCSHEFCLSCFEGTMENTNLVCPLCRLRIGSWLRRVKKESKLVNEVFWEAIQKSFPELVENRRRGVDENLEEKPEIRLSHQGEIRKEYEIEKQKDYEEVKKRLVAEQKASEEYIKKLNEEEDYQKAVMEEKLKLDEQIAKKLAAEMCSCTPLFSKSKMNYKKIGPMDKFIRKDNETITSQNTELEKPVYNFANKEYTCRVLHLDTADRDCDQTIVFSPIIKKKIQQIQKIVDTGVASDSSDCIESEMRYFKPIDYRLNPPSQAKAPIKIFPKKPVVNAATKIMSPGGSMKFCSNVLESAFVRLSMSLPPTTPPAQTSSKHTVNGENTGSLKRIRSEDNIAKMEEKRIKYEEPEAQCEDNIVKMEVIRIKCEEPEAQCEDNIAKMEEKRIKYEEPEAQCEEKTSPIISYNISSIAKKHLFGKKLFNNINKEDSPLFYGFESNSEEAKSDVSHNIRKNGTVHSVEDESTKKLLQEKADLEFAKKLQEELDRSVHNTRSSRSSGRSKRQTTLDEIIKSPYKVQ